MSATRERDALVDDMQAGGAQRLLGELAHVGLDRDHVARPKIDGSANELGHLRVERLAWQLRVG